MNVIYIFIIIATLGALVFFHEFGHLLTAKFFGIGVRVFSLGFGPKLASKVVGHTEYRLSLIPLGGYVSFKEVGTEQKGLAFEQASIFARSMVVLAGPVSNILLAFVLFWGVFWYNGFRVLDAEVGHLQEASPAEKADLRVGDSIVKIAGADIVYWDDVLTAMAQTVPALGGKAFDMVISRQGEIITLHVEPEKRMRQNIFGQSEEVGFLGINPKGPWKTLDLSMVDAAIESLSFTWESIVETGRAFYYLIAGSLPADAIGGPIMITQTISEQAEKGLSTLLVLIAIISVNLAVVNLLPLPVLDGGHLLMFAIEAVRGRPISEEIQKNFQRIGLAIILLLMILGTFNDIVRL